MSVAIEVRDISKQFRLYNEKHTSLKERVIHGGKMPFTPFWALRDVNVEIRQGETFGILGRNGCGKSTLLKCIAGILKPTSGEIRVRGSLAAMLELGAGFQPDLSGRDNIFLNGSLLGCRTRTSRSASTTSWPSPSSRISSTTRSSSTRPACTCAWGSPWPSTSNPTCSWWTRCWRSVTRTSSGSAWTT